MNYSNSYSWRNLWRYQASDDVWDHSIPAEQKLACAVVLRAVVDATGGSDLSATSDRERAQARSFCIAPEGPWRRAREFWCTIAGVDADGLRQRVLAQLADGSVFRRRHGGRGGPMIEAA